MHFRSLEVLRGVDLKILEGESVGLIGDSGSGKTTLGRILAGLERPSGGEVLYRGMELRSLGGADRKGFRRGVQFLFQDPEGALNPLKTIGRSLDESCRLAGLARKDRGDAAAEILRSVGLSADVLPRFPGQLSGGQNQRVALARILLLEPRMIVLDEPTSGLDASVQALILHLLRDLRRARGLTYLLIAHDRDVVGFLCDRAVKLEAGVIQNHDMEARP
jgi:peptide/nickel transport system ATP-binding protein